MKLDNMAKRLDGIFKADTSYGWDNAGLIISPGDLNVRNALLCLEMTPDVMQEALERDCQLIVCHHPLIFSAIKKITYDNPVGAMIMQLIKNNTGLYAAHTNFDKLDKGLNDYVADLMNLTDKRPLIADAGEDCGMGRIGNLSCGMSFDVFIDYIKEKLSLKSVRIISKSKPDINTVAVVTGAGYEFKQNAFAAGADVYITGDIKYHEAMEAYLQGFSVIDAGHFGSEKFFKDAVYLILEKEFKGEVNFVKSDRPLDPFETAVF